MNLFLTKIFVVLTFFFAQLNIAQNQISPNDLSILVGEWHGSLTYVDYTTNKPYTMPADVTVGLGNNKYHAQLLFRYPNEPNANSKDKIKISKDGLQVNKAKVISRKTMTDNEIEITTEYYGKDNNQKALIRAIYIMGPERFIIRKEVKFDTGEEWLMRNEYNFTR